MDQNKSLLDLTRGGGCGCKIAPDDLVKILCNASDHGSFPNLLRGNGGAEDAAVWELNERDGLISTVDFFYPVVNDAFLFGQIAAANAMSDVYAMGGKPLLALAILGWPIGALGTDVAAKVMEGATRACREAGIPIAGGHSVESTEPFFGLAVNGLVEKANMKRNDTASSGDLIFLTKPLGHGLCAAAHKRGLLTEGEAYQQWTANMCRLNKVGTELGRLTEITAMTDVTGFGLLGHALEMAATGLTMVFDKSRLPVLPAAAGFAAHLIYPDLTTRLYNSYAAFTSGMDGLDFLLYCDPQTSGGLMFTAASSILRNPSFRALVNDPVHGITEVGRVETAPDGKASVRFIS